MNGQDDWRDEVIRATETVIEEMQPELIAIVTDVVHKHSLRFARPEAVEQAVLIFDEIQTRSFLLGVKAGTNMVMKALSRIAKPKEKETTT
jgi:hypothetical protein